MRDFASTLNPGVRYLFLSRSCPIGATAGIAATGATGVAGCAFFGFFASLLPR
jgi:hypothetical protein